MRRREFIALLGGAAAIRPLGARAQRPPERILYFTCSAGYRHEVIPLSKAILTQLGRNSGAFEVTATEDPSEFSTEELKRYAAVMFYTSGELPMSDAKKTALLNFVRVGGGFLGVHSATDTFYTWPDYLDLIGGYFNGHPWQSGEVAATTGDFVVETGNNHASVGARATIILIGISHAATVALTFVNAASSSLTGSRSPVAAQARMASVEVAVRLFRAKK